MEKEEKKLNLKENLKIYYSFAKKYKWILMLVIFFVFLHEAKSVLDKFIFKIAIDKSAEFIAGTLPFSIFVNTLIILLIILTSAILISIVANWLKFHFLNRLEVDMIIDVKQRYFSHILSLDHKFYTGHKTGSLISRLTRGASGIEKVTDSICFEFAPMVLQFIVLVFTLIYLDKTSAIIIFTTVGVFLFFSIKMQKGVDRLNLVANTKEDTEKGNVADIFTNIDSIKYFGKESFIRERYKRLAEDTRLSALKSWDTWRLISAGQSIILGIGTILLLSFSFKNLIAGDITIGTITFVYTT
jgi:ATP-binding cassette subfamily B protein